MKKMKMDDDFQNYLVEDATFVGSIDIPEMIALKYLVLPKALAPYTSRRRIINKDVFLHCFLHDFQFSNLITETRKHIFELSEFSGIICPDPTITVGGSKTINQAQVYFSRAVGYYLQKNGIFAIPCIRWGDESTYEYCFLGVPKNYIVAISTHGCIMPCKENQNLLRNIFIRGLPIMLKELRPNYVIVYGRMPNDIFAKYKNETTFINFKSDLDLFFDKQKEEKLHGN